MKGIIQFEFLKFCYSKKNLLVLLFLAIALLAMITYNIFRDNNYWLTVKENLSFENTLLENEERTILEDLDAARKVAKVIDTPDTNAVVAELEIKASFLQKQRLYCYQQIIMARDYSKDKAKERLELWIARDQHLLLGHEAGLIDQTSILAQNGTALEAEKRLAVNQTLLRENIEPLNSPYEMTAVNFLYRLGSFPKILIVVVALMMLSMDLFSGDIEGGAYKVLYSHPQKRASIHGVKLIFNIIASICLVTVLIAVVFAMLSLVKGVGEVHYPTFFLEDSYTIFLTDSTAFNTVLSLVPWSVYITKAIPFYLLLSCFVLSFTGMFSLFLGNTANTLSAVICVLFLDYSFRLIIPSSSNFYLVWPFAALSFNDVFQGVYRGSALAYLFLFGGLTLLFMAFSLIFLIRKDMKGGPA